MQNYSSHPLSDPKAILAPISLGELIDKITILQIKSLRLSGLSQDNVNIELQALKTTLEALDFRIDPELVQQLKDVNLQLWNIEDEIRDKDRQNDFGESFISLARSVYQHNDRRSAIKKHINLHYGSAFVEEKSYKDY
jgi:hypothetical protein